MTVRVAGWVSAGLAGVLSAGALGCGTSDSGLLRDAQAAGLKDTLEQARAAVDDRNCARSAARLQELRSEIGNLGGDVDRTLRQRLRQEVVDKLAPAVEAECDAPKEETIPTTTTPAPTGPTGPAEPEPEPTPEPEPEPEPEETTTTETTPPPSTDTAPAPTPEEPVDPSQEDPGGFGEDGGGAAGDGT